jgi:AmiR/NasT family two-component response regulator
MVNLTVAENQRQRSSEGQAVLALQEDVLADESSPSTVASPLLEPRGREQLEETIRQLQEALHSRIVIEQAKGILAARFSFTLDEAFRVLRWAARRNRMQLHGLAEAVVTGGDCTPATIVALLAQCDARRRLAH